MTGIIVLGCGVRRGNEDIVWKGKVVCHGPRAGRLDEDHEVLVHPSSVHYWDGQYKITRDEVLAIRHIYELETALSLEVKEHVVFVCGPEDPPTPALSGVAGKNVADVPGSGIFVGIVPENPPRTLTSAEVLVTTS